MTTFHPFPRLPYELRCLIWKLSAEPRTVHVWPVHETRLTRPSHAHYPYSLEVSNLLSSTPVPGILHACRESRHHSPYRKLFFSDQAERPYIWVNYEMDMISIGTAPFDCLKHSASLIRRLKFERENSDEYWFHSESRNLAWFSNVVEYHVIAADGLPAWWGAWDDFYWSCERENLKLIDKETGEMMNSYELDRMMDDEQAENWREDEMPAEEMATASVGTE